MIASILIAAEWIAGSYAPPAESETAADALPQAHLGGGVRRHGADPPRDGERPARRAGQRLVQSAAAEDVVRLQPPRLPRRRHALREGVARDRLCRRDPLHGEADLAAKVATHEGFPGWFDMLDRGATTLWENWSEERCVDRESNCHPMFGSVDEWMVRHVLGISVCDDAVGCDRVRICPRPLPGITSASGWFDTPKGRISVSWKVRADGTLAVEKSVPPGISADSFSSKTSPVL